MIGIIDFGNPGIIDEHCDFIYLLEYSTEEIGKDFIEKGRKILKVCQ